MTSLHAETADAIGDTTPTHDQRGELTFRRATPQRPAERLVSSASGHRSSPPDSVSVAITVSIMGQTLEDLLGRNAKETLGQLPGLDSKDLAPCG